LPKLSEVEWEKITKIIGALQPLEALTKYLQSRTVTISDLIPSFFLLRKKLANNGENDLDIFVAQSSMLDRLNELMSGWEEERLHKLKCYSVIG
jgi:hypothetical protein